MYVVYVYCLTAVINIAAIVLNGVIVSAAIAFFVAFTPKETVVSLTNKLLAYLHINYNFIQSARTESDLVLYWTGFIMFFFIALALTPLSDALLRKCYGFGKPLKDERDRLSRLFAKVCEKAGKDPSSFKLYVTDKPCLNAYALGSNNIAITRKLLMTGSDNDIMAVYAHEIGHIHYSDSAYLKVFVTVNIIGQAALWSMKLFASISGFISRIPIPFLNLFVLFLSWCSWFTVFVLDIILVLPLSFAALMGSRHQEYRADQYACSLGFGDDLYNYLHKLLASGSTESGISILWSKHPSHRSRLNNIETYINKQKERSIAVNACGKDN